MTIRTFLSSVLRGEAAAELTPPTRERLENFVAEALAERSLTMVRDECAGRQRQSGGTPGVEYLLGLACALNGETERALQTLLSLGERLVAGRQWEPLAAVAEQSLALEETHAGARLLVRAHEGLARDPERLEALERAFRILTDDLDLGLLLAQRLGEAGEGDLRRQLLAEMMPAFAAEDRFVGLEEGRRVAQLPAARIRPAPNGPAHPPVSLLRGMSAAYLWIRAEPPCASACTCPSVAMVVSPG